MKVREVMTAPAITVGPDTTFAELVDVLLTNQVSGLPVVDHDGRLLGIVTEADLVSKEAYGPHRRRALGLIADFLANRDPQWIRKGAGRTASELMTSASATASPDDDLRRAARAMLEQRHKRLPVVEHDRVVGIVSRSDLLAPFHRSDEALQRDIDKLLADPLHTPETHRAVASVVDGIVTLAGSVQFPSDVTLVESMVARVPGVVAVDGRLWAREPEPRVGVAL